MDLSIDPRSSIRQTSDDPKQQNLDKLRESCREFEAIYVQEMFKAMRKTVPESGLFEKKDMENNFYKEMLDMEMARTTAAGKGMGIGEAMYNQLKEQVSTQYNNTK